MAVHLNPLAASICVIPNSVRPSSVIVWGISISLPTPLAHVIVAVGLASAIQERNTLLPVTVSTAPGPCVIMGESKDDYNRRWYE